jgi:hypothetical protein
VKYVDPVSSPDFDVKTSGDRCMLDAAVIVIDCKDSFDDRKAKLSPTMVLQLPQQKT